MFWKKQAPQPAPQVAKPTGSFTTDSEHIKRSGWADKLAVMQATFKTRLALLAWRWTVRQGLFLSSSNL